MIKEVRAISFSDAALVEAVQLYGTKGADGHRFSVVEKVEVTADQPPTLMVQAVIEGQQHSQPVMLSAAETAASLILLCRREKIPLPHKAEKALRLEDGQLTLIVTRQPWRIGNAAG